MAHKNIDRCKETTSTTGTTSPLVLTGAVAGYVAVCDATAGLTTNGDTGWFEAINGTEWEIFLGTRVDATHLARTTVISSSNGGAPVNFTAAPVVFSTVPGKTLHRFTNIKRTTAQSIPNGTHANVSFDTEFDNTVAAWSAGAASRITAPAGAEYVRLTGSAAFVANATGFRLLRFLKNGTVIPPYIFLQNAISGAESFVHGQTRWMACVPGDYFEMGVLQGSGAALNLGYASDWPAFSAEFK